MRKLIGFGLALGLAIEGVGAAHAAVATQSFTVQITLVAQCIFSTATANLDFGTNGVLAADVDASTTMNVQCTNTTPYTIALDAGVGSGATVAARKMTNGAATVTYSLYKDAARSSLWGTAGADLVSGTGNGSPQSYTVYGRTPAQATPAPGVYTDTVTATVTY
jgi:spore coat protein U-like protein